MTTHDPIHYKRLIESILENDDQDREMAVARKRRLLRDIIGSGSEPWTRNILFVPLGLVTAMEVILYRDETSRILSSMGVEDVLLSELKIYPWGSHGATWNHRLAIQAYEDVPDRAENGVRPPPTAFKNQICMVLEHLIGVPVKDLELSRIEYEKHEGRSKVVDGAIGEQLYALNEYANRHVDSKNFMMLSTKR